MPPPTQIFKGNAATVRVNGRKVGTCTSSDVDVTANKSNVPLSDGLGISGGFPIGTINISTFEPAAGIEKDLPDLVLSQDIVSVTFTQGGKTTVVKGTGEKFQLKSQTDKRMTDGAYTFSGVVQRL